MKSKTLDPGLGEKYLSNVSRSINPDGSFNIIRKGTTFHYKDLYQYLLNISWPKFFFLTISSYIITNVFFAVVYFLIGQNNLQGSFNNQSGKSFYDGLFFSVQTLTTVGYGGIVPKGLITNSIAAIEAMIGLLGFAITTGLLYGRFSKPSARILYSNNILISPHEGNKALVFRIANLRNTNLMELEARVLLSTINQDSKEKIRTYTELKLERNSVYFFPLNWTIVHPIDNESPLLNADLSELKSKHAEILILIKGFDDTFSQVVHSRYSYNYSHLIWNAKFTKPYHTNEAGKVVFNLDDLHKYELISN